MLGVALSDDNLFLAAEQRKAADLAQIAAEGVIGDDRTVGVLLRAVGAFVSAGHAGIVIIEARQPALRHGALRHLLGVVVERNRGRATASDILDDFDRHGESLDYFIAHVPDRRLRAAPGLFRDRRADASFTARFPRHREILEAAFEARGTV